MGLDMPVPYNMMKLNYWRTNDMIGAGANLMKSGADVLTAIRNRVIANRTVCGGVELDMVFDAIHYTYAVLVDEGYLAMAVSGICAPEIHHVHDGIMVGDVPIGFGGGLYAVHMLKWMDGMFMVGEHWSAVNVDGLHDHDSDTGLCEGVNVRYPIKLVDDVIIVESTRVLNTSP